MNIIEIINKEYSSKEKESFVELIKVIINLSNKAYRQGLLSLEDDYPSLNPFLLRKGTEIIIGGCDVKDLRNILDNYIQAKKYSDAELLENFIIKEGLLLILSGDRDKILFEKILSMLGEDFFEDLDYSVLEEEPSLEYDANNNKPMSEECNIFEDRIMSIVHYEDMEKLVRRVGYFYMALALKGSSGKLNVHVRNNLSFEYIVDELNYEIECIGPCRVKDVISAQKFILSLL